MANLEEILNEMAKEYGEQEISATEFTDIISRLQPYQTLISYIDPEFFQESYQELSKQPVTFSVAVDFVRYVAQKNRDIVVGKDMSFYQKLVSRLMEDNIHSIRKEAFANALRENPSLNESIKQFIVKFFQDDQQIDLKKLRKVLHEIYNQLNNYGTLKPLQTFKLSGAQTNLASLKSATESIELGKQYIQQYKQLMETLEAESVDPGLLSRLESFREVHDNYYKYERENRQKLIQKIQTLQDSCREKEDQVYDMNDKMEEMKGDLNDLDAELGRLESKEKQHMIDNQELEQKIIQMSTEYSETRRMYFQTRDKLNQIVKDNKNLKQELQNQMSNQKEGVGAQQFQDASLGDSKLSNKQSFKEILGRLTIDDFKFQDTTLKQELDDANLRLMRTDERHRNQLTEIQEKYLATIQQLESRIRSLESQPNQPQTLGDQGITESIMNWKNSKRQSQVHSYRVSRPPQLDKNPKLDQLIMSRISRLPIQIHIQQKPKEQPRLALVPNIHVDLNDLYVYDYCDVAEVATVKSILQAQRQQCDYQYKYIEKRLLFFSCDVKLIKQNGDYFDYYVVVGPLKLSLISGSKHLVKDQIPISQIAKLIIPDNSNLIILKCGRDNDLVLFTNRRKELMLFLRNASTYQGFGLCIMKMTNQQNIQIRQNKRKVRMEKFKGFFSSPYWMSLDYSWFVNAHIQIKNMFNNSTTRECFALVNQGGIFLFQDDIITTKSTWKEKLIICIPITPLLILGRLENKRVRLGFDQKFKDNKDVLLVCRSTLQQDQLILRINAFKRRVVLSKQEKMAEEKKILNYLVV